MTSDTVDSKYEIQCPACKTTKYRNPQMKLMVNVCGHALCDSCVKLLFIKESSQCPECEMVLKRSKFRAQIFEDPIVEKEIDIRRRVKRIFYKHEEDFDDSEEYNLYVEEMEAMVFNLVYDVNKVETEKKLESLERLNRDDIKKYAYKRSRAFDEMTSLIEGEKIRTIQRKKLVEEEETKSALNKVKHHSSVLEDLLASEGDASLIVKSHAEKLRLEQEQEREAELIERAQALQTREHQFSTGIRFGTSTNQGNGQYAATSHVNYEYEEPVLAETLGVPEWDELESKGYLAFIRKQGIQSIAGGYTEHYAAQRALQDLMGGHILETK